MLSQLTYTSCHCVCKANHSLKEIFKWLYSLWLKELLQTALMKAISTQGSYPLDLIHQYAQPNSDTRY